MKSSAVVAVALAASLAASVAYSQSPSPAPAAGPAAPVPTTRPAAAPTTNRVDAGRVMDRMLRPAAPQPKPLQPLPDTPAVDTTSGAAAVAPAAPSVKLMREGTYVVDRVGRLRRTEDNQQAEFVFDSDGTALQDPPMVILQNLTLMQMENAAKGDRDRKFRVTGMVTEYRGRNCILLDKAVPVAEGR